MWTTFPRFLLVLAGVTENKQWTEWGGKPIRNGRAAEGQSLATCHHFCFPLPWKQHHSCVHCHFFLYFFPVRTLVLFSSICYVGRDFFLYFSSENFSAVFLLPPVSPPFSAAWGKCYVGVGIPSDTAFPVFATATREAASADDFQEKARWWGQWTACIDS